MTLRKIVYDRCTTHAGLVALIGDRCYPERIPEETATFTVTFPLLTYLAPVGRADAAYRTHDNVNNPVERAVSRVQINCYDATGDDAESVADQAVQAWSGYRDGCDVGSAFISNRQQNRQDALKRFRAIVDVTVDHAV